MKKRVLVSLVVGLMSTYTVRADIEVYAGINDTTFSKVKATGVEFEAIDDDVKGFELGVNYQWFEFIGVEAGYTSFGDATYYSRFCRDVCIPEPDQLETDITAWNIGVNARVPLGPVTLRASANQYIFDEDTEMLLDNEWVYRIGLDVVEIADTVTLGIGYKKGDVIDSGYDARVTVRF